MNNNDFQLIETMLYNGGIEHIDLHLSRLKKSAGYFDFNFNKYKIFEQLNQCTESLNPEKEYRIRMLLYKNGNPEVTVTEISGLPDIFKIAVSFKRTDSSNIFLYHKTTNRDFYNSELERAKKNEFFDFIFMNEKDEVTEGAITNIYIKRDGMLLTPKLSSGLLSGTLRTHLLSENKAVEGIIHLKDIKDANEVFISNAVIGLKKVANHKELKVL